MSDYRFEISKDWVGDGPQYVVHVIQNRKYLGIPESVALEAHFDHADEVALWVQEHSDGWL